jgi:predicted phage gp36 major capsid-like protein
MRYLDEIYNLDRSVEQVYNSYRRKLENNPDDAEKFLKDNFGLYVVRNEVRSTMEAIRALNAQARAIDKMTDLSPEERRVIINDLRAQQNDLARDVYRLRRQVTEEQRTMDASR